MDEGMLSITLGVFLGFSNLLPSGSWGMLRAVLPYGLGQAAFQPVLNWCLVFHEAGQGNRA